VTRGERLACFMFIQSMVRDAGQRRLLDQTLAAGYSAIVFTVDAPIKLVTLELPATVGAVNLEPWSVPAPPAGASRVFDGWLAAAPTWDDLTWLRRHTAAPLLIKGILHADDAERALAAGCDGIIVTNQGGRLPVLYDGGIRHGRDAFVALTLGARAALIGRPYLWGLAADGARGVAQVIRLPRDELKMTMALCGWPVWTRSTRTRYAEARRGWQQTPCPRG